MMTAMPTLWIERYARLRKLGLVAAGGLVMLTAGLLASNPGIRWTLILTAFLAIVPAVFYLFAVTIWHWKSRYRGSHSDLWGVLLLIETSGWFKLVYLFRHIVPDARASGRYAADVKPPPPRHED
jgi:hypothetical protein